MFFRKKVNIVILALLGVVILFAYIYPAVTDYDPFVNVMNAEAKHLTPAAAIAKSDPNQTGLRAFRMGLVAYIIPFIFLLSPAILLVGSTVEVLLAVVTSVVGIFCLTGAVEGCVLAAWLVNRFLLKPNTEVTQDA